MAKVFKFSAYVVDSNGEFSTDDRFEDCLIYCTQNDINLRHLKIESADIGEWEDGHPLNFYDCPLEEFEKYFKEKQERIVFKSSLSMAKFVPPDSATTVSFIPVCDNCNCALPKVSGKVGDLYVEPNVCPKCHKIIECVRLPIIDVSGKLNYEED